jgi:hypothetical protein
MKGQHMKKKMITLGATAALVMSMGTAALAQPVEPGSNGFNDPQLHAGHWGYVKSDFKAKGVPALEFHDDDSPYATGLGGWAAEVKQGGAFK